ncbi:MAG: SDR family NAD(P)-dependent oxidoreductase [Bacteroidetes bacterium]|nr:SDR family NAD(P)-dependent oxidoreductase [Bacteroidota bacterium]
MNISSNTVLITGGGTGIGLCIAEEFVKSGNEVIICGRREEKLKEARTKLPRIHTRISDVSNLKDRDDLFNWVTSNFEGIR